MKDSFRKIFGSICAPRGFKCASVFCDIKRVGTGKGSEKGRKDDLALIVSDVPATVAGMFTKNQVCAAPVKMSRKVAAKGSARVIVVNSGNANACTGKQGMRDAAVMAKTTARCLGGLKPSIALPAFRKISDREVFVCSTGRIGIALPIKNVARGIRDCAPLLARSATKARQVAEAIMTTDTRRKEIAVEITIDNRKVRIGGICKGAGMIQPGMATMLAFLTTDVAISSPMLRQCLREAVAQSFNRITVDGDMSTNDSVIMLANGLAGNSKLESRKAKGFESFENALNYVCLELAKMIVRDGEGVSRFVTVRTRGARNDRDAEIAARSVANSALVKTSWCGGDPNWGRVLCALGYSQARVDESRVDVGYAMSGSREVLFGFRHGKPANVSLQRLARIASAPEFDLHVDLNLGHGEFVLYASDLTEKYVAFNKGDVSDPTSLGG